MKTRWMWAGATGAGFLAISLACAGGSGGASLVGSGNSGSVYAGVPYTQWDVRAEDYRWDMQFDQNQVVSTWLGDDAVAFEQGSSTVGAQFTEGAVDLQQLDACHMGGSGPHPHKADKGPLTYRMDRTWPPCSADACTYEDLPFTRWHIYAEDYHYYVNFSEDGQMVMDWVAEQGVAFSQSGGTMSSSTPKGELVLERLDRCHWAGKGPHPKTEGKVVTYRLKRAWPTCGCDD